MSFAIDFGKEIVSMKIFGNRDESLYKLCYFSLRIVVMTVFLFFISDFYQHFDRSDDDDNAKYGEYDRPKTE